MKKEILKDFHSIMDEQIKRVQQGLAVQTEIMVMKDLKRLADMEAFIIEEDEPLFKTDNYQRYEVNKRVRLKWQGEDELVRLRKENDELKSRLDKLNKLINGES